MIHVHGVQDGGSDYIGTKTRTEKGTRCEYVGKLDFVDVEDSFGRVLDVVVYVLYVLYVLDVWRRNHDQRTGVRTEC